MKELLACILAAVIVLGGMVGLRLVLGDKTRSTPKEPLEADNKVTPDNCEFSGDCDKQCDRCLLGNLNDPL